MGYYTHYSGEVISGAYEPDVARAIAELDYFNCVNYPDIYEINDVIGDEPTKWYDYDIDMREISKQFPDALILIHGEGEDPTDLWNAYFKNGKCVRYNAEIIYPEFDPEDLS